MEPDAPSPARRRRAGARRGRAEGAPFRLEQAPWRQPRLVDRPVEPLSAEGVEDVHRGAMRVLSEIGIEFLHPDAVAHLRRAGCRVEGTNVRMDEGFVAEMVSRAPGAFTITPRNPDRAIRVGDGHIAFANVSSPPNYMDVRTPKQSGTHARFVELVKLTQAFECIHMAAGYPVEPVDLHASVRHLDCLRDKLILSDKVIHAYCLGRERVEDAMEMVRLAAGLSHDEFDAAPRMYTNINSVSPLKHDFPMLEGAMAFARRRQPVYVTPFTLAGAMAPVTMAGAVTLSVAEALAAVALLEFISPGTPVVIGTFTSNVDMRSGAPAFGTPEYMRATQMTGQMARRYGLPLRSSGTCAANVPDGQAMWETMASLWAAVQSGSNVVYHAAGWLEGGLVASPEKFVMDCEVLGQIMRYCDPALWDTSEESLAVETIRAVGPDGHFFGTPHTQARYKDAFYQPFLSDWRNYEAWAEAGGTWTAERAYDLSRRIIDAFEPPPMDEERREAVVAFAERRKAEGGAPTDF